MIQVNNEKEKKLGPLSSASTETIGQGFDSVIFFPNNVMDRGEAMQASTCSKSKGCLTAETSPQAVQGLGGYKADCCQRRAETITLPLLAYAVDVPCTREK